MMGWVGRRRLAVAALAAASTLSAPAAAQSPGNSPAAVGPAIPAPYRVNPGDELQISVWGEDR